MDGKPVVWRMVALVVRPLCIFFGTTLSAHVLLGRLGTVQTGYWSWLVDLPSLSPIIRDAIWPSLLLFGLSAILAGVIGAALGGVLRTFGTRSRLGVALLPLLALSGPPLAVTLLYWIVIRFRVDGLLGGGTFSLLDDPADAIGRLLLPAVVVALPAGAALATMFAKNSRFAEPVGIAGGGAFLASRAEPRDSWRIGFPAGLIVIGMITGELIFRIPGLFRQALTAIFILDGTAVLDAVAVIALGGIAIAFLLDVLAFRSYRPEASSEAGLRLDGYATTRPSGVLLALAAGLTTLLALSALLGAVLGEAEVDVRNRTSGPLTDGHLLGTDFLGRDLLSQAVRGLWPAFLASMIPAIIALVIGGALAGIRSVIGSARAVFPDALVDLVWWPLPVVALLAFSPNGDSLLPIRPLVLALVGLGLAPTALRMIVREVHPVDGGTPFRIAGAGFLLTAHALGIHVLLGTMGFGQRGTIGTQLIDGVQFLPASVWGALVPAVVAITLQLAFLALGASLIHRGWWRTTSALGARLEREADDDVIPLPPTFAPAAPPTVVRTPAPGPFPAPASPPGPAPAPDPEAWPPPQSPSNQTA